MGHSGEGFAASALAMDAPAALIGILNFAGGRGRACRDSAAETGYAGAFGNFGDKAAVPALWLYSITDKLFGPEWVDNALDAYAVNGAPVRLERFGKLWYSSNGHPLQRPVGGTPIGVSAEVPGAPPGTSSQGSKSMVLRTLGNLRCRGRVRDAEPKEGFTSKEELTRTTAKRATHPGSFRPEGNPGTRYWDNPQPELLTRCSTSCGRSMVA